MLSKSDNIDWSISITFSKLFNSKVILDIISKLSKQVRSNIAMMLNNQSHIILSDWHPSVFLSKSFNS